MPGYMSSGKLRLKLKFGVGREMIFLKCKVKRRVYPVAGYNVQHREGFNGPL